jgi:asparagine synthase (glutamine-hydrolysing)
MSGIAGICYLDGRPLKSTPLERMLCAMADRGPDGQGYWLDTSVGLAQSLLANSPETNQGAMPLRSEDGQLVVVADVRIDNRDELISILELQPSASDPELLLNSYAKWGEDCLEHLLGDFSFAIWDRRQSRLLCARDHFGTKPFYYCQIPGQLFAFASQIKPLLSVAEIPRRLDEVAVAELFEPMLEGHDPALTFYHDIRKLPAAHCLRVQPSGATLWSYWALGLPKREIHFASDDQYEAAFRELFTRAVQCRLRSLRPAGVLLSGGIDSAAITGVAQRVGAQLLHTFSAKHTDQCPETPYIDAVLATVSFRAHSVRTNEISRFAQDFDDVISQADQPYDLNRHFASRMLYRTAQQHGVRVVLDGVDGDATASTESECLAYLLRSGQWRVLRGELQAIAQTHQLSFPRALLRFAVRPLAPQFLIEGWNRLHGRSRESGDTSLLKPEYVHRAGIRERLRTLQDSWVKPAGDPREDQWRNLRWGHIPFSFESYDREASRFAIEPRHPFFDRRLVEFCLALPANQKFRSGWTKSILRRAMVEIIPDCVRWRADKPNINRYFIPVLLASKQKLIADIFSNQLQVIGDYVNPARLRARYDRYLRAGSLDDLYVAWTAASLVLWLRRTGLAS